MYDNLFSLYLDRHCHTEPLPLLQTKSTLLFLRPGYRRVLPIGVLWYDPVGQGESKVRILMGKV